MPVPLKPLWELRAVAASAPAAVRVIDLATTVTGPHDAWQRRGKPQPACISATVTFRGEPGASASTDSVASDTVHYGQLSKAILDALRRPPPRPTKTAAAAAAAAAAKTAATTTATTTTMATDAHALSECALGSLVRGIWHRLTGLDIDGAQLAEHGEGDAHEPFLRLDGIHTIEIQVRLPKASLVGDGASATQIAEFAGPAGAPHMVSRATALRVHGLRVPTLIGVNDNERTARQTVLADVEVDRLRDWRLLERYYTVESESAEIMASSSFETLEALAKRIARHLSATMHGPKFAPQEDEDDDTKDDDHEPLPAGDKEPNWRLHISLRKPIAITLADAACVELNVWTRHVVDAARLEDEQEHTHT